MSRLNSSNSVQNLSAQEHIFSNTLSKINVWQLVPQQHTMSRSSSELFHQSSIDSSARLPSAQSQPYLFSTSPFPPVAPENNSGHIHSQPSFQFEPHQRQTAVEYEVNDSSASMDEDFQTSLSSAQENSTVSPLCSFTSPNTCKKQKTTPLDIQIGSSTSDMYSKMRKVQLNHLPQFQPNSPYIKYRRYLVDWLAETSEELRFKCSTVHVAASFLDRVLLKANDTSSGRCSIPKHLWQLVAMVCLRIAGKFEEREEDVTGDGNGMLVLANNRRMNAVEAFTRHLGDAAMMVTSAQIKEWEIFVLESLGWNLSTVTPVHCLSYYEGQGAVFVDDSWNGRPLIEKIPRYIKKYNDFFANLCLQDYFYAQYSPSHLAASILYASRHALSLSPPWRPELEELTGHAEEEVFEVFTHIWKFYSDTFPSHARKTTSPKGIEEVDAL